jgi:hypothetical protein
VRETPAARRVVSWFRLCFPAFYSSKNNKVRIQFSLKSRGLLQKEVMKYFPTYAQLSIISVIFNYAPSHRHEHAWQSWP